MTFTFPVDRFPGLVILLPCIDSQRSAHPLKPTSLLQAVVGFLLTTIYALVWKAPGVMTLTAVGSSPTRRANYAPVAQLRERSPKAGGCRCKSFPVHQLIAAGHVSGRGPPLCFWLS